MKDVVVNNSWGPHPLESPGLRKMAARVGPLA